jgi:hypothetical protein
MGATAVKLEAPHGAAGPDFEKANACWWAEGPAGGLGIPRPQCMQPHSRPHLHSSRVAASPTTPLSSLLPWKWYSGPLAAVCARKLRGRPMGRVLWSGAGTRAPARRLGRGGSPGSPRGPACFLPDLGGEAGACMRVEQAPD